jgi:hypothetical protein
MNRLVAAFRRADRPGAAAIARLALGIVVAPLAEVHADGMNGRQIHHVEAHLRDIRQPLLAIRKSPVLPGILAVERGKNSYHALNRAITGSTTMEYSRSDSVAKRLSG